MFQELYSREENRTTLGGQIPLLLKGTNHVEEEEGERG